MAWTLVTGGAQRLGREICTTLAALDYDVVIHYNTSHKEAIEVQELCLKQGVRAEIIQGDFSTLKSTAKFCRDYLDRFTLTRNLVNNVGNFLVQPALTTSPEEWHDLFQNNLHAPLALIQALSPSIQESQGAIVNVGVAGLDTVRADTYCTAYSCAKLSLWMLTKSLAKELTSKNVRVNMVSPGYLDISVDLPANPAELPMGRPGKLAEVADLIAYLLEPTGSYITGQNIEVAGGIRL